MRSSPSNLQTLRDCLNLLRSAELSSLKQAHQVELRLLYLVRDCYPRQFLNSDLVRFHLLTRLLSP